MNQLRIFWSCCLAGLLITGCQESVVKPVAQPSTDSEESKVAIQGLPRALSTLQQIGYSGSVHLFDGETQTEFHSDSAGYFKKNVPASTFKIFTSLIALEKGLLKDQYEVKAWNNRVQKQDKWNKDLDLKEAFALSTNWFFEDLTTAFGVDTLNSWLDRIGYPVKVQHHQSKFWLDEGFTISPQEQIALMKKLAHSEMPFSKRTIDITRDIMMRKDTLGFQIYGKTGWGTPNGMNVGWFVGWAEFPNRKPIYFATCIEHAEPAPEHFEQWRRRITEIALEEAYPNGWRSTQQNH
ncbi:MAG: class beta-lactamase [Bacteroidota bacterium]|jgi:beta-lactamase class D